MSEFKFLCPECGQKISCDAGFSGRQISCPACQKTLTVPSAGAEAPAIIVAPPDAPRPITTQAAPPRPRPPEPVAARPQELPQGHYSWLAIASLISSVFVFFGFVPGIICGRMAKARMRDDIFLGGEKMANAGLIISYCMLAVTLVFGTIGLAVRWRYHPVRTVLSSADAAAIPDSRIVDEVKIEKTEEEHSMEGQVERSTSLIGTERGRRSLRSGYISYSMRVLPQQPMSLNCRYWGGEPKGRWFDIAIDDQVIATQKLDHNYPNKFFYVEYKIPVALTQGKNQVTVVFQAHPEWTAGTVYGCQMLKR